MKITHPPWSSRGSHEERQQAAKVADFKCESSCSALARSFAQLLADTTETVCTLDFALLQPLEVFAPARVQCSRVF